MSSNPGRAPSRRSGRWVAPFLLLLILAALALPVTPGHGMLWLSIWNFTHVPVFAAVVALLLRAARAWPGKRISRPLHYVLALAVGAALGGLTELLQFYGPRDADPFDVLRNLQGLAIGTLLTAAFDVDLAGRVSDSIRTALRGVALAIGALVLIAAAWPAVDWALAYRDRDRRFPVLCDFEGPGEYRFVSRAGATVEVLAPPKNLAGGWTGSGEFVARVVFHPGIFPRVTLFEPRADWSGHDQLVLEIFSEDSDEVALVLRVDDATHDESYQDRFNRTLRIVPGLNVVRVDLDEIRQAPHDRELDLTRVRSLVLFLEKPLEPVTLWTDAWRLEGARAD